MMKVGIEEGQFPITIKFPDVRKQSLTVNAAIELKNKLADAIDAQKESSATSPAAMAGSISCW